MLDTVRAWLSSAVAAAFLTAAAQSLLPEGAARKAAGLAGGLAMVCVLLSPLTGLEFRSVSAAYADCAGEIESRRADLQARSDEALERLIAQRAEAYISDKAAQMGAACAVRVLVERNGDGVPVPAGAVLTGACPPELADELERELGIPKERLIYHEAD